MLIPLFWGYLIVLFSQDVESIKKAEPFKINGSIGASVIKGSNNGYSGNTLPFMYTLNGNVNMEIYSIAVPVSFVFSHGQLAYTLPFNRYGMSPRYKWIRLHLGHRNMNFNPYTLAGRTFFGAGLELNPGKFRFAAMYGKLQDARKYTPDLLEGYRFVKPSYSRKGYAFKAGIGDSQNFVDITLFKGWDEEGSIPKVPDSLQIFPEENLALGLSFRKVIVRGLSFSFDGALSAFTRDVRKERVDEDLLNKFSFLFSAKYSSRVASALSGSLDYSSGRFHTGLRYQRIDPYYQTMGAHYNLGDIENYTLHLGFSAFRGTTQISGSIGFERNDLLNLRLSSTERIIGSVGIQYQGQSGNSLSAGYHNYTTTTGQFDPDFFSDTLRIQHQMHTVYVNPGYRWGPIERASNYVFLALSYNKVDDNSPLTAEFGNMQMISSSLNYSRTIVATALTLNAGVQYHRIIASINSSERIGLTGGVGKRFREIGMNTNLSATIFRTLGSGGDTHYYFSSRISASKRFLDNHSFNLGFTWMSRPPRFGQQEKRNNDYRLSAGYQFNF